MVVPLEMGGCLVPPARWFPQTDEEWDVVLDPSLSLREKGRRLGVHATTVKRIVNDVEAGLLAPGDTVTATPSTNGRRYAPDGPEPETEGELPSADLSPWLGPGPDTGPVTLDVRQPSARIVARRAYTVVVLSDIHLPEEDPDAMLLAHDIVRDVKPDVVIINGDLVDFKGVAWFRTSPYRRVSFAEELEQAAEKLQRILAWAPDARWVYIEGNHEVRLQNYLWDRAPELAYLPSLAVPALLRVPTNVTYLAHVEGYRRRLEAAAPEVRLGSLYILHGDTIKSSGNVVNVARTVFLKLLKPVLVGHWHRSQIYLHTDYEGQTTGAWATPCLTGPRAHYGTDRVMDQGISVIYVDDHLFEVNLIPFLARGRELRAIFQGRSYRRVLGAEDWL